MSGIWFVTTCMGRIAQLRESLPTWLRQPAAGWVVVDWSCPDGVGAWVRARHPEVRVVEVPGEPHFHHARARNTGFRAIANEDPGWVCFLDADTRLADGFALGVRPLLREGAFVTGYSLDRSRKGLGGLLVVHRRDFEKAGGFDETIEGYGTNGADLRVRLFFQGLDFVQLPHELAEPMRHGHRPAMSRYASEARTSVLHNTERLAAKIERWEQETGRELPRELFRKEKVAELRARRAARERGEATRRAPPLPSFSIAIETDNLAGCDGLPGLERTLDSLDQQTLPPTAAREVLLLVRPDQADAAEQLRERFPWLRTMQLPAAPADTQGYYWSKMAGARATTGDVVALLDSDCVYEPETVERLVRALADDGDAVAASGETFVEAAGVHGLAMAIAFVFDRPTGRTTVYTTPSNAYTANIVAFRRTVLLEHPIPHDLPCYRVSQSLHARHLKRLGLRVLREPRARSVHPPPRPAEIGTRFMSKGHDAVRRRLLQAKAPLGLPARLRLAGAAMATRYRRWARRTAALVREDPRRLAWLPIALAMVTWAGLVFGAGATATALAPDRATRRIVPRR